jgi:hypothetical protein
LHNLFQNSALIFSYQADLELLSIQSGVFYPNGFSACKEAAIAANATCVAIQGTATLFATAMGP